MNIAWTPLGIDTTAPRLSWTVGSAARGQTQTAYRVLVADSPESLKKNSGTLWDSGKVVGDETACVVYAGKVARFTDSLLLEGQGLG